MVIPLRRIIGKGGRDPAFGAISRFTCRDDDVEAFLKHRAVDFESRDKSRTYLIFDDASGELIGYFTLSLKALPFKNHVSKSVIKNIDGYSKDVQAVGIILIGQFGKDSILAKDIDGASLFGLCLQTVRKAQNIIGGRFVLLECHDIEKVISFYAKHGFISLQHDETDNYLQMVRRL